MAMKIDGPSKAAVKMSLVVTAAVTATLAAVQVSANVHFGTQEMSRIGTNGGTGAVSGSGNEGAGAVNTGSGSQVNGHGAQSSGSGPVNGSGTQGNGSGQINSGGVQVDGSAPHNVGGGTQGTGSGQVGSDGAQQNGSGTLQNGAGTHNSTERGTANSGTLVTGGRSATGSGAQNNGGQQNNGGEQHNGDVNNYPAPPEGPSEGDVRMIGVSPVRRSTGVSVATLGVNVRSLPRNGNRLLVVCHLAPSQPNLPHLYFAKAELVERGIQDVTVSFRNPEKRTLHFGCGVVGADEPAVQRLTSLRISDERASWYGQDGHDGSRAALPEGSKYLSERLEVIVEP
jgi:hypothetical protein